MFISFKVRHNNICSCINKIIYILCWVINHGGVNDKTIARLASSGMTCAVAGSYIFKASDYRVRQCMDIAVKMGLKAVIFHTNYIVNFRLRSPGLMVYNIISPLLSPF